MKTLILDLPMADFRAIEHKRQPHIRYVTNEYGEPLEILIRIREHHTPTGVQQALGRPPKEA